MHLLRLAVLALGLAALGQPGPVASGTELARRAQPAVPAPGPLPAASRQEVLAAYNKLPLSFVPNAGQADARVRLYAQAPGARFFFTQQEAVFAFTKEKAGLALALRFPGASVKARPEGRGPQPGRINYLIGSDPGRWQTDLPTHQEVVYRELWPGIDLVFRGAGGQLKYELHLRPGARVRDIRLAYGGAERLSVDGEGNLLIDTPLGRLTDTRPLSFQEIDGKRVPVVSRFVLERRADTAAGYGFAVEAYDPRRPLVIDPGLVYSTYLGGSGFDQAFGIAVDSVGNAYVTGLTDSPDFPTTPGAFDTAFDGFQDAFVTKFNTAGSALVYSTYLGGSDPEEGNAIAVDAAGNAYVTGSTESVDFPITPGAFETTFNGGFSDAFVTKLNAAGSALVYSTYLGGSGFDQGFGIAVHSVGNAYVTGLTDSSDFPTTPGAFDTALDGFQDAFVTTLDPAGSALVYSTYLGGSEVDEGFSITVDSDRNAYVTGWTTSPDFPTSPGAFDTSFNFGGDVFVTKLNPAGSALVYSTYLGGSGSERGLGVAVDSAGNAYVTGETLSLDFPTTPGAFDAALDGLQDSFVTKLDPAGSSLVYSTYLGGSGADAGFGIAVDSASNAYVTGPTESLDFPTTLDAFDTTFNGVFDAYVTKLNAAGSALVYSTYLGGSGFDLGRSIAVDAAGSAYVTGGTGSPDFPTSPGAFDTTFNGSFDAFVTKLDLAPGAPGCPPNDDDGDNDDANGKRQDDDDQDDEDDDDEDDEDDDEDDGCPDPDSDDDDDDDDDGR